MNFYWQTGILIRLGMQVYNNYVLKGSVLISNANQFSKVSVSQREDTAILNYYGLDVYNFNPKSTIPDFYKIVENF